MATNPSNAFRNFLLRRSQFLYRLESGTIQELAAPFQRARSRIVDTLTRLQMEGTGYTLEWRIKRLESQLSEINGFLEAARLDSNATLEGTLRSLAITDSDAYYQMLQNRFGTIGVNIERIPYRQVEFIATNGLYGEKVGERNLLWTDANKRIVDDIRREMTSSIIVGEDMQRAIKRITDYEKNILSKTATGPVSSAVRNRAKLIARSEIQYVSNSVARTIYRENQDVLKGVQYSSALDRRTCLICASDDGRYFPFKEGGDHTGPILPRHPLCRCVYVPITKSWRQLEKQEKIPPGVSKDKKGAFTGDVLDAITYDQWLKTLSKSEQIDILGPGRYKLWEEGKVKISEMAKDRKIYTIKELEKKSEQALNIKRRVKVKVPKEIMKKKKVNDNR